MPATRQVASDLLAVCYLGILSRKAGTIAMVTGKSINSVNRIIAHSHGAREMLFVIEREKVDQNLQARLAIAHLEKDGDSILPATIGKVSEFNARGKEIKRRDLPLIKNQSLSTGAGKTGMATITVVCKSEPWMCIPSTLFVRPWSTFLSVIDGKEYVVTRRVKIDEPSTALIHVANLMLEFFQEFEIFDVDRKRIAKVQARQLQWDLLPPGKYPWKSAEVIVKPYLAGLRPSEQGVIEHRIRRLLDSSLISLPRAEVATKVTSSLALSSVGFIFLKAHIWITPPISLVRIGKSCRP